MIYTVTLNPSLDYIVGIKNFVAGSLNRSESEKITA
ncbi:MAG TPA: 1-phosphofructokinase, partial [Treponema sp.]|nr:1-phosphofructokinase [Treponema sp.]